MFPGDLPEDPEAIFEVPGPTDERRLAEEALALRFLRFRPPRLERTAEGADACRCRISASTRRCNS